MPNLIWRPKAFQKVSYFSRSLISMACSSFLIFFSSELRISRSWLSFCKVSRLMFRLRSSLSTTPLIKLK